MSMDFIGVYLMQEDLASAHLKQEMSLKKTNGVGLKKRRKYNTS